jgi:hypothetical protein
MTEKRSAHLTSGWLVHAVAASCVAVLLAFLAAPGAVPAVPPAQARGVAELAALLAAPNPDRLRIEENVRSWSRFPPEESTGRRLAETLAACSLASRPEAQRLDLARRVYAITNGSGLSDAELAATLSAFRQAAAAARCSPQTTVDLEHALSREARTDPRPRADWW